MQAAGTVHLVLFGNSTSRTVQTALAIPQAARISQYHGLHQSVE